MSEANKPAASSDNTKLFSVLSYIGILWLIGLLAAKDNKAVMFHVNQGILLTLTGVAGSIAVLILAMIPFLGWLVSLLLFPALYIFTLVLLIMGIMNAAKDKQEPLPLIGKLFTIVK